MTEPTTPVAASDDTVLITRIFDAPRAEVFEAWTDPDEVAAWFGPDVELHDHGAKTRMTLTDGPMPAAGRGPAEARWSAAFDKLAARVGASTVVGSTM